MDEIELTPYDDPNEIGPKEDTHNLIHKDNNSICEKIIYIYNGVVHIFIFSLFESMFFWFYIVQQEEKAFRQNLKPVKMIGEIFCINSHLDLSPLRNYIRNEQKEYNNHVSVRFTYILNGSLMVLIILMNIILKIHKQNLYKVNFYIIRQNTFLLICLFIYEYLFFQNIIYNYKPKEMVRLTSIILDKCEI